MPPPDGGHTLIRFSELSQYETDPAAAPLLPVEFCLERNCVILGKLAADARAPLTVGMVKTRDEPLLAELARRLDREIKPVQLNVFEIRQAISRIHGVRFTSDSGTVLLLDATRRIDFSPDQEPSKIIDDLLSTAVRRRATDVHLEFFHDDVDLRFRVDGVLYQITTPVSPDNFNRVVARIKVLCNLDIAERRHEQNGRFSAIYLEEGQKRQIDFRVSAIPGTYGQEVVLRVLDPARFILDLDRLAFDPTTLECYKRLVRHPGGLILTTGPTGSGKTTTLYATIQHLRGDNIKIVAVEDPIEYEFPKVNQKNVSPFMGFADYLRAFLRQNPDIILVGEIRDEDTAEVAVRAATTGHLVLSSLHTRDAVGAIGRMRALGITNDYISHVLIGVLGQRLVRTICEACREEAPPPAELVPLFYAEQPSGRFARGKGCERCGGSGYSGVMGVYELLQINHAVASAIGEGMAVESLREVALRNGYDPLVEDALAKAEMGLTTLDEISRRIPPKFPRAGREG